MSDRLVCARGDSAVERGAREGGASVSVEVVWKGPLQENDRAQPNQLVQQFLAWGVDGLALATQLVASVDDREGAARESARGSDCDYLAPRWIGGAVLD